MSDEIIPYDLAEALRVLMHAIDFRPRDPAHVAAVVLARRKVDREIRRALRAARRASL